MGESVGTRSISLHADACLCAVTMDEPAVNYSTTAADAFPFFLVAPDVDGAGSDAVAAAVPRRARHQKGKSMSRANGWSTMRRSSK